MFKPFNGGSSITIQDIDIFLPPTGFVPDYYTGTGDLIPSEILFTEYDKEDQYWRIPFDRAHYNDKRKEERKLQKQNPEYFDEQLEEIRLLEWNRRLNGVWFMNNGIETYIPGCYYFYLVHWQLDIGYSKFRQPDLERGLFWQYCCEDPKCLGMLEVTVRRWGKSYHAGAMAYEYVSRQKKKKAGIQSKSDDDAKKSVYLNSIVEPHKHIVDFFKPIQDEQKGKAPKQEMSFAQTIKKGDDFEDIFNSELSSIIDYRASDVIAYDGAKLHRFIHDEVGKTKKIDVYERHTVVRKCCTDTENDIYIGKMIATTTVADIDSGGEQFQVYWEASNVKKKDSETKETESGLYRYFLPAYKTKNFDIYGFPDEELNKKIIIDKLNSYINNPKMYNAERRMNPMSESDLFAADGLKCPFNVAVLDGTLQYIQFLPDNHREQARRFDIIWLIPDVKAVAIPNPINGKWSISWLPPEEYQNQIFDSGHGTSRFKPLNDGKFAMGCDPVSMGKEADHGSSDAAIVVYRKADVYHEAELFSENFIADYLDDPDDPETFYEDQIIACFFFGCQVLIEKQKFDIYNYMKKRGYLEFVMSRPENTVSITADKNNLTEGIAAGTYTIELYVTRLKSHIAVHGNRCRQPRLINDWRKFTVATTTKRDLSVASGWAKLAAEKPFKPKAVSIPLGSVINFRNQQSRH